MTFLIHALPPGEFAPFFDMSEAELRRRNARRIVVADHPGTPCRVSLADAEVGETVVLVNYCHQAARSPYRASHAIFVRQGAAQACPAPGEVPEVFRSRLISVRRFDGADMMVDAEVAAGSDLEAAIWAGFADPAVRYLHLHFAGPGCFAARVTRS